MSLWLTANFRFSCSCPILARPFQSNRLCCWLSLPRWHKQWERGTEHWLQGIIDGSGKPSLEHVESRHHNNSLHICSIWFLRSWTRQPYSKTSGVASLPRGLAWTAAAWKQRKTSLQVILQQKGLLSVLKIYSGKWKEITCTLTGSGLRRILWFHS